MLPPGLPGSLLVLSLFSSSSSSYLVLVWIPGGAEVSGDLRRVGVPRPELDGELTTPPRIRARGDVAEAGGELSLRNGSGLAMPLKLPLKLLRSAWLNGIPDWVGVAARGGGVIGGFDSDFRLDMLSLLRPVGACGLGLTGTGAGGGLECECEWSWLCE